VTRLRDATLARLPAAVERPAFDPAALKPGIVHLGIGAFHRAHQAVFTEDAIAAKAGDWGIIGASLKHPGVPDALSVQDGLYTVETLGEKPGYRVIGVMKEALFAPRDHTRLLAALASAATHAVTLTLSEKGYCLNSTGTLDFSHSDIAHDLTAPETPHSAIGWLVKGLEQRRLDGSGPVTILSCDNLQSNGEKLGGAVTSLADRLKPGLAAWISAYAAFPSTLVDCIVPAADDRHRARVRAALEMDDAASVQREEFSQWVIEDRFAGPLPAWRDAGADIVHDLGGYQRLKLHVLNTAHSALAYRGLPRGHEFVRQAIADSELRQGLDAMMEEEIGPALAPLNVADYWRTVKTRFENPMVDHRLAQIAEDGSLKLPQRLFPLLIANAREGRALARMASLVGDWLAFMARTPSRDPADDILAVWARAGADPGQALDNPDLFPAPFRDDLRLREAILR
jgi:fructuronate reductase